jgi:type I restriction enzyme S subunit
MEKADEHNEQWKTVKLGDCLTIGNGCDYKHLKAGDIPVFGTGGLMTHVDDYLYDGETVCIGRKGTINHPLYHDGKIWTVDTLFYTHSFIDVIPKFIYYAFCNIAWNKYNEATGVPSLSKETIYKIEISVPSLPAQRRIAAILSAADKVIEQTRQLISKYKSIKQGMMEDLLKPKEGWKKVRLGEVGEIITGPFGSSLHEKDYTKTGTPIVNPQNIVNGRIIPMDKCLVSDETVERLCKFKMNAGDIVIARRGEMGRCAVVEENQEGWLCGTGSFVIKVDSEKIDPIFIQLQLSSDNTKIILENNSIGATMSNLNQGILCELEFLVPDLPEQRRIAKILSGIDRKIEAEEKVLEKYEKIKKGLMEKLLRKLFLKSLE